jgi:hypothetical protein
MIPEPIQFGLFIMFILIGSSCCLFAGSKYNKKILVFIIKDYKKKKFEEIKQEIKNLLKKKGIKNKFIILDGSLGVKSI